MKFKGASVGILRGGSLGDPQGTPLGSHKEGSILFKGVGSGTLVFPPPLNGIDPSLWIPKGVPSPRRLPWGPTGDSVVKPQAGIYLVEGRGTPVFPQQQIMPLVLLVLPPSVQPAVKAESVKVERQIVPPVMPDLGPAACELKPEVRVLQSIECVCVCSH